MDDSARKTLSDFSELMLDWKSELNPNINPYEIGYSSRKTVKWCCHKCGRIWELQIHQRTVSHIGCTCDAMKRKSESLRKTMVKAHGSLRQKCPEAAALWDYSKNGDITPDSITCSSEYNAWWIDKEGHSWQARVASMTKSKGVTSKLIPGKNDFATMRPDLLKEWNFERNAPLNPNEFHANSKTKVWWTCYKGHEWAAPIAYRTAGRGCPECNKEKGTSFPEQALYYYVKQAFPSAENRYRIGRSEIDIYIPEKKIGIEFDGSYYHSLNRKQITDERKNAYCIKNDILLIRLIAENYPIPKNTEKYYLYHIPLTEKHLDKVINETVAFILDKCGVDISINVDVSRDSIIIREQYMSYERERSIANMHPELLNEWDTKKNGKIKPEYVSVGSSVKYWWKCQKCGFSWSASAFNRVHKQGCPCCSGNTVVRGINDLATTNPKLSAEWDWEQNEKSPYEVTQMSNYQAHWVCSKCGYRWKAAIANRQRGTGCVRCAGKLLTKEKSLSVVNPEIAKQWDYSKNEDRTPETVFVSSSEKAFWKCEKGHVWEAIICSRTKENGNGCPYCGNKLLLPGFNDLVTVNPGLLKEWDYEKNTCKPNELFPKSDVMIFWKCQKGHSFQAKLSSKKINKGCPYCSGKKPLIGKNDLATTHPHLAKEWDYEKNAPLTPNDVKSGSNKSVFWKCQKCGYRWSARIFSRAKGRGCSACAGKVAIEGKNDLATTHPFLAVQWDHDKNGDRTPHNTTHGSRYDAYWKCPDCGFEWRAPVCQRSLGRFKHKCENKIFK